MIEGFLSSLTIDFTDDKVTTYNVSLPLYIIDIFERFIKIRNIKREAIHYYDDYKQLFKTRKLALIDTNNDDIEEDLLNYLLYARGFNEISLHPEIKIEDVFMS